MGEVGCEILSRLAVSVEIAARSRLHVQGVVEEGEAEAGLQRRQGRVGVSYLP